MACSGYRVLHVLAFIFGMINIINNSNAQTTHEVGDSSGWTLPSASATTYSAWSSQRTFKVGDCLTFNFVTGMHTVAAVTEDAFSSCDATNVIGSVETTSPVTIKLTSKGTKYFICSISNHCAMGQKLSINVVEAEDSDEDSPPITTPPGFGDSPPNTTTPDFTVPPPFSSYTPYAYSMIPPPPTPCGPSYSAAKLVVASFSVIFLSFIIAFLF